MSRRAALAFAAVLVAAGATAAPAGAGYGNGARIASVSLERLEQGDDASTIADIASGGRYVAFETRARNFFGDDDPDPAGRFRAGGIFRRDLETGALQLVADGDLRDEATGDLIVLGARSPSISADGRYVVFATAQKLIPADTNDAVDVYVRDMNGPLRAASSYALASAANGGDSPARYADPDTPRPGRNPGTDVFPGTAISDDGRRVVFRTVEVNSDLASDDANPLDATPAPTDTPPRQLFVRDLSARTTRLITRNRPGTADPGGPAGGATGPATLSGDGSTVAWTGRSAAAQTTFLAGETESDAIAYYLWQRIDDGAGAPTRRVTGAADVDDPGCAPGSSVTISQTRAGPCYGPLTDPEGLRGDIGGRGPALSADGYTVAFLVTAGPRPDTQTDSGTDLWVTSMRAGVSRKAGSRELTREGSLSDARAGAPIDAVALSADGRRIAAVTSRGQFALPFPSPVGTFRRTTTARDVVLIDLGAGTIERVTRGYGGGDTSGDVVEPVSVSSDATQIAFGSRAPDLFFGDGNAQPDVFVAQVQPEPVPEAPPPVDNPLPPVVEDETPTQPRLGVRQAKLRDGSVELTVTVPAAGVLEAQTRGRVAGSAKEARQARTKLPLRVVAKSRGTARTATRLKVKLKLSRRYRADLRRRGNIRTSARIDFRPASGGTPLRRSLSVVFSLQKRTTR